MVSFAKVTSETYAGLTPVEDRIYYLTDTGEVYLNGTKYGSDPQAQADWDESDSTSPAYILNKPDLAAVATSGSYNDLDDTPDIPDPQVQADWDESDSSLASFIKDKPSLAAVATSGNYYDLTNRPSVPVGTGNYLLIANNYTNTAGSTVTLEKVGSPRDNTFQYCTNYNNQLWYDYTLGKPITLSQYQYVMFRNKDGGKLLGNGSLSNYYHFSITGSVNVSGDVISLKDKGIRYNMTGAGDMCYLFKDCTGITDASGLVLPSTTVYQYTYYGMFQGCTNMVYGPLELPAMTLGTGCYQEMFRGCTLLKNAPRLPAKVMAQECYKQMFTGCSVLTGPVILPGTTLAANCYRLMFNSCYALNDITILCSEIGASYTGNWVNNVSSTGTMRCPASVDVSTRDTSTAPAGWTVEYIDAPQADWDESDSTLSTYIKHKPAIPAGQIQSDWDESDSADVSFIKNKPVIPVQAQVDWDESDSTDVTYIKNKPALAAVATSGSYNDLLNRPAIPYDGTDYLTFYPAATGTSPVIALNAQGDTTSLNVTMEYTTDGVNWSTYTIGTGVTISLDGTAKFVQFRGNNTCMGSSKSIYHYFTISDDCYAEGSVMSLLDSHCLKNSFGTGNYAMAYLFKDCAHLLTAPRLPATSLAPAVYYYMFSSCSGLTEPPELPATTLAASCYYGMFYQCTSLTQAPFLPAVTAANLCYSTMFSRCTALSWSPELPLKTAATSCCSNMFITCTSLTEFSMPYLSPSASSSFSSMFGNCTSFKHVKVGATELGTNSPSWLNNVASTGVIECPSTLDTTTRDVSHVPAGWTVIRTDAPESVLPVSSNTEATATVYAGAGDTIVLAPTANLTLNVGTVANTSVGYAEVVIDLAAGATVTAGTGLTLVDIPTAGKRNVCVVRWQGGAARLYVVDVMDIPA